MTGGNEFTFLTSQRAVVDHKVHGDSRLGDLLERNRLWIFRRTDRITNVDISNTGNSNDGTDLRFLYLYTV